MNFNPRPKVSVSTYFFLSLSLTLWRLYDAACSSSIVSTHAAMSAISSREIDAAASCGVTSIMSVLTTGLFNAAGMLAADGRCKTLDAAADGYVRGESRGVIILEETANASGAGAGAGAGAHDRSSRGGVAVIGTAVNQDGRSSSLTAPNGPSQQAVIRASLSGGGGVPSDAAVTPAEVACLQMHGTGTGLGDPIEVGSVIAVFKRSNRADDADDGGGAAAAPLTLEAVKSLVGHTVGTGWRGPTCLTKTRADRVNIFFNFYFFLLLSNTEPRQR